MSLLMIKDVRGLDRGFHTRADILTTTADGVDLNNLWDEFQTALALYNQTRDPILALFTHDTTDSTQDLPLGGDLLEFEEASEFGIPKAGRTAPSGYVAGYPLHWYDFALRYTEKFLRDAPAQQVTTQQIAAQEANNRLQFREALKALTTPATLGSRSVNENGAPIFSLYAGSTDDAPPPFAGRTFAPGHSHYLVSGAATVDGQDLDDLIQHITHHGYGTGPSERVVILIHPDQGKAVRAFRAGVNGSPYDFIPSETAPAYLSSEIIVGQLAPRQFNGLDVIGSFGKALVVESYYAFPGYVVGVAVGGTNSARNVLAVRSHPRPEYRGLRLIPGTNNRYPLFESTYSVGVGFGVRNRGAAAVMEIKASGTYTPPSLAF